MSRFENSQLGKRKNPVLINELIWSNAGLKILRSYFLHWCTQMHTWQTCSPAVMLKMIERLFVKLSDFETPISKNSIEQDANHDMMLSDGTVRRCKWTLGCDAVWESRSIPCQRRALRLCWKIVVFVSRNVPKYFQDPKGNPLFLTTLSAGLVSGRCHGRTGCNLHACKLRARRLRPPRL